MPQFALKEDQIVNIPVAESLSGFPRAVHFTTFQSDHQPADIYHRHHHRGSSQPGNTALRGSH